MSAPQKKHQLMSRRVSSNAHNTRSSALSNTASPFISAIQNPSELISRAIPFPTFLASTSPSSGTPNSLGSASGGAFSGKDPSKVDRSAAYAGRYVAKNIVAAGLAERCEIQVSYAIGVAQPTSISLNTFGTGKISDDKIIKLVRDVFDLRPYAITTMLDLLHPMYQETAAYGHFGRTPQTKTVGDDTFTTFTWERTDRAEELRAAAGL